MIQWSGCRKAAHISHPQNSSNLSSADLAQCMAWSRLTITLHTSPPGSGDIFVPCSFAQSYLNRSWIIAGKLGGMEGWEGWS